MHATALAASRAADEAFVHLHGMLSADLVPLRADHAGAELVQYLEGGLVAAQAELTLELQGGLAGRLRRDHVGGPEPGGKRCVCLRHDGSCRQGGVCFADAAAQHDGRAGAEAIGFAFAPTFAAIEPGRPTDGFQILGAGRVIREHLLELGQAGRKSSWVHGGK